MTSTRPKQFIDSSRQIYLLLCSTEWIYDNRKIYISRFSNICNWASYSWFYQEASLLLTQSLQPCRCLSSRQLFTERIGCIGKWLSLGESYWTLQIPHPMDAGCDHFEWKNVWLRRYSPSQCVVSIPFSNIHHNVVSPRHGRETWFWKVSWQRRIRGGAKVLRETHGKSSSQMDTKKLDQNV